MNANYSQHQHFNFPPKQQGMVLIVGLIMVLLLTIIGLAAIRGSGLQQSMAFNMRDRNMAFQSAESALRVCEAIVDDNSATGASPLPSPLCADGSGMCQDLNKINGGANAITVDTNFWLTKAMATNLALPNVASQPTCLVEELKYDPDACAYNYGMATGVEGAKKISCPKPYRASAIGTGAEPNTQTVIQSLYTRHY